MSEDIKPALDYSPPAKTKRGRRHALACFNICPPDSDRRCLARRQLAKGNSKYTWENLADNCMQG